MHRCALGSEKCARLAGFMSSNIVRWIKSPGSGNMRDTLGPAQFPQALDMARLKHELSNGTCLSPAVVEGLATVLQKKLHAFHYFELQLVRRQRCSSMHGLCSGELPVCIVAVCARLTAWSQVTLLPSCSRRFESVASRCQRALRPTTLRRVLRWRLRRWHWRRGCCGTGCRTGCTRASARPPTRSPRTWTSRTSNALLGRCAKRFSANVCCHKSDTDTKRGALEGPLFSATRVTAHCTLLHLGCAPAYTPSPPHREGGRRPLLVQHTCMHACDLRHVLEQSAESDAADAAPGGRPTCPHGCATPTGSASGGSTTSCRSCGRRLLRPPQ